MKQGSVKIRMTKFKREEIRIQSVFRFNQMQIKIRQKSMSQVDNIEE